MLPLVCVLLGAAVLSLSFCCMNLAKRVRLIENVFQKVAERLEVCEHG